MKSPCFTCHKRRLFARFQQVKFSGMASPVLLLKAADMLQLEVKTILRRGNLAQELSRTKPGMLGSWLYKMEDKPLSMI